MLGGLFGSVIPFARHSFSPFGRAAAIPPSGRTRSTLRSLGCFAGLSKTGPILLLLDDVQWVDEASAALVKHLLPAVSGRRLRFPCWSLLVANDKSCFAPLGFDLSQHGVEVAYLSVAEQWNILVPRGRAVLSDVAVRGLGSGLALPRETDGGLLWPLQVVGNLALLGRF